MQFKPAKSRSFVIKRGVVVDRFRFAIACSIIPTLWEKTEKSLRRLYSCCMKDTIAILNTPSDLCSWLTMVDKSGLPGRFKSWIYQHTTLPRILWLIMIYDITMTMIIAIEISSYRRRCLGLPRSLSSITLYGSTNTLQLPFKRLTEEYMVTKTREVIMFKNSKDPKVATTSIEVHTGRRWNASRKLEIAEERLRHKALIGTVAVGRTGLGFVQTMISEEPWVKNIDTTSRMR